MYKYCKSVLCGFWACQYSVYINMVQLKLNVEDSFKSVKTVQMRNYKIVLKEFRDKFVKKAWWERITWLILVSIYVFFFGVRLRDSTCCKKREIWCGSKLNFHPPRLLSLVGYDGLTLVKRREGRHIIGR